MTPSAISGISCSNKPLYQLRARAAEHDFDAAPLRLDLENDRSNPFVGVMRLARDLFAARQNRLETSQRDGGCASFAALNHAGDHLADLFHILVDQRIAFGFANLLDDDLFGGLSPDAADHLFRIECFAVTAGIDGTVFARDADDDIRLLAVLALGRGHQRRFDGLENDLRVNVLVAVKRVDDSQQLVWIHVWS